MKPCTVEFPFSIGDRVRHKATKFEGAVTHLTQHEDGTQQAYVQNADGRANWISAAQIEPA